MNSQPGESSVLPDHVRGRWVYPGYLYAEARNILLFSSVRFGPHPFRYIIDGAGAAGGSQSGKMMRPHKRVSWPP